MSNDLKEYLLVKTGGNDDPRLVPAFDEDRNFVLSLGDGEQVKIVAEDTRTLWRHRKFFALLTAVRDHLPEELSVQFPTVEKILIELKLQLGYMDVHTTLDGRDIWVATNSISFARTGEAKFKAFVFECRDVILKQFFPTMEVSEFDENFLSLMFD